MESIGDKLRNQREQKGYSIEQIARDTNIAKRYLEALEAEDFSVFPGDPYLIGFLRNYADYLGIDPDQIVTLYKNFKIQSQPVPMDELLVKSNRKPIIVGISVAAAVIILGVLGYLLIPGIVRNVEERRAGRSAAVAEETTGGTVYTLDGEMIERRFYEKDVVQIPHNDEVFEIQLTDIGEKLNLSVPGGTLLLQVGDERAIDLDGDANMDIKVAVNDLYKDAKQKSAVLRFDMFIKATLTEAPPPSSKETTTGGLEPGSPGLDSREVEPSVIFESPNATPFAVNITFRGYCLFRYFIDGRDRDERYFQEGDAIVLEVNNEVILWMSNAGNALVRIAGRDFSLGGPGQVSARMISWSENEEGGNSALLMQAIY